MELSLYIRRPKQQLEHPNVETRNSARARQHMRLLENRTQRVERSTPRLLLTAGGRRTYEPFDESINRHNLQVKSQSGEESSKADQYQAELRAVQVLIHRNKSPFNRYADYSRAAQTSLGKSIFIGHYDTAAEAVCKARDRGRPNRLSRQPGLLPFLMKHCNKRGWFVSYCFKIVLKQRQHAVAGAARTGYSRVCRISVCQGDSPLYDFIIEEFVPLTVVKTV